MFFGEDGATLTIKRLDFYKFIPIGTYDHIEISESTYVTKPSEKTAAKSTGLQSRFQ